MRKHFIDNLRWMDGSLIDDIIFNRRTVPVIAELKPLIQDKYTHVMEVKTTEDLKVLYEKE